MVALVVALIVACALLAWLLRTDSGDVVDTRERASVVAANGQPLSPALQRDVLSALPSRLPVSETTAPHALATMRVRTDDGETVVSIGRDEDAAWASVGAARWVIANALLAQLLEILATESVANGADVAAERPPSQAELSLTDTAGRGSAANALSLDSEWARRFAQAVAAEDDAASDGPRAATGVAGAATADAGTEDDADAPEPVIPPHWNFRQTVPGQYTTEVVPGRSGRWAMRIRSVVDAPEGVAVLAQTADVSAWPELRFDASLDTRGRVDRGRSEMWLVSTQAERRVVWHEFNGYGDAHALGLDWTDRRVSFGNLDFGPEQVEIGIYLAGRGFVDVDNVRLVPEQPVLHAYQTPTPNAIANPGFEDLPDAHDQGDQ